MKKLLIIILWFVGLCADAQTYEAGVSKELAELRAQNISNVSYDLTFDIPASIRENVTGTVTVEFFLKRKSEVVLDFQGRFPGFCIANGKKWTVQMKNEHIVIPKDVVKKGINRVELNFTSLDKALNRHADYLYTQFVPDQARSCFPCFDQPDLRAKFATKLNLPEGWKALVSQSEKPMSTYSYAFTAGKFEEQTAQRGAYTIRVFHREHAPEKLSQLSAIIDDAAASLSWMGAFTGIRYPFGEFGMVILPDYQVSGIEHLGASRLSDRYVFLSNNPSRGEQQRRKELIAYEAAHQWFGDMVTLNRFEDVWALEVLNHFMVSKIVYSQLPDTERRQNFLSAYQSRAMAFDRTEGTHPIATKLTRLTSPDNAKQLYDDIIYAKAPVMMHVLEDLMGTKELQKGLQKYLTTYYFKSASWDDLVSILDNQVPAASVRQFNEVWVKQKGMPAIHTTYQDGRLVVSQTDPFGRDIFWRQKFEVRLIYDFADSRTVTVDMTQPTVSIDISQRPNCIIPNYDGRGYGRFTLDKEYTQKLIQRLIVTRSDLHRYALLLTLHDNYLMGHIPASYFGELHRDMMKERNPLIMQMVVDHMFKIAFDCNTAERQTLEQCIMDILSENKSTDCRQLIVRKMSANATSPAVLAQLQELWEAQDDPLFNEHDYMEMAYRLALAHPARWQTFVDKQRERLSSEQLREEFDYVSRACTDDEQAQRRLFNDIVKPGNRPNEAWALHVLQLLSADVREPQNNAYITASLNSLEFLQDTSDILFVSNWLNTLLQNHKSDEARQAVENFLRNNPTGQENLRNKVLLASWLLRNIRTH